MWRQRCGAAGCFCDPGGRVSNVGHGCFLVAWVGGWECYMESCPSLGSSARGYVITMISHALGPIYLKGPALVLRRGRAVQIRTVLRDGQLVYCSLHLRGRGWEMTLNAGIQDHETESRSRLSPPTSRSQSATKSETRISL